MGEEAIFRLARDFYAELEASPIRALFPGDLAEASQKLAKFLTPLFGGPPLYQKEYGPPRMRARHIPFVIKESERGIWLACFFRVLDRGGYGIPEAEMPGLKKFLEDFSAWMVNAQ